VHHEADRPRNRAGGIEPYECCDLASRSNAWDARQCEPTCFFQRIDGLTLRLWKVWQLAESSYQNERKETQYGVDLTRLREACWFLSIPQEDAEELLSWIGCIADALNAPFDEDESQEVST